MSIPETDSRVGQPPLEELLNLSDSYEYRPRRNATSPHLCRGTPGECQQQYSLRIGATNDEVGYTVGRRVGLSCAGSGNDQQGPRRSVFARPVFRGLSLRQTHTIEILTVHARGVPEESFS